MVSNCQACEKIIFYDWHDKHWKMRIEGSHWDEYYDSYDYEDIDINFCFECGKDYRGESID